MGSYEIPPESPFASLGDEEIRVWYAFMKVQLRLRYEMDRQLRHDSGITLVDYDVLVALTSESAGTLTVTDIAIRVGAERSRISHQVQRMAGRGLVGIEPNEADRRASNVTLTPEGRSLLAEASPKHIDFVRSVFLDALSPSDSTHVAEAFEKVFELLLRHGTLPRPVDHP
ncbi:MarR family winged helix-turn-helix transcriptional regulator [soil metagenome]